VYYGGNLRQTFEVTMTREEIIAFFAERQSRWDAHDARALAADHAENGTVQSPMHGARRGRAAIEGAYRSLFEAFPDWRFTSGDLIIEGDRVAQPFTAEATHVGDFMGLPGTNRRSRVQGVRIYEMAGGLIHAERRFYDFTSLLLQIGVLKGKPA
jgi:predicted ester cyclase